MKNQLWARPAAVLFAAFVMSCGLTHGVSAQDSASSPVITDKSPVGELDFWNKIKDSKNKGDFQTYIQNFPNGMFFDPAMQKFVENGGSKSDLSAGEATATKQIEAVTPPDTTVVTPLPLKPKQILKATKKKVVAKSRLKSKKKVSTARVKKTKIVSCGKASVYYKGRCHLKKATPVKIVKRKKPVQTSPDGSGGGGSSGGGGWSG